MKLSLVDARARLASAAVGRLATTGESGQPHVVPFCFALDGDALYTAVDDKPKSSSELRRIENIGHNPRASVLVDHYSDDWSALWWVRVDGAASLVTSALERERAVIQLRSKYAQYADHQLAGAIMRIECEEWRSWSAT